VVGFDFVPPEMPLNVCVHVREFVAQRNVGFCLGRSSMRQTEDRVNLAAKSHYELFDGDAPVPIVPISPSWVNIFKDREGEGIANEFRFVASPQIDQRLVLSGSLHSIVIVVKVRYDPHGLSLMRA
jgi:hypothetical protein